MPLKALVKKTLIKIVNKGTGAGGANTNKNGKAFEEKTNCEHRFIESGAKKIFIDKKETQYYLEYKLKDRIIYYASQNNFKNLLNHKYNIPANKIARNPDEAFIIKYNDSEKLTIKILEKKNQNCAGSVEDKMWAGPLYKNEYKIILSEFLNDIEVYYSFCISQYLKDRYISNEIIKFKCLRQSFNEFNIHVLFGDDDDYFEQFDNWLLA